MDPMGYETMKAQQAQQAQQPFQNIQGCAADTLGCTSERNGNSAIPLRIRFEREFSSNASRQRVVAQALDIITRHPEFEEFLLLQRIVDHIH